MRTSRIGRCPHLISRHLRGHLPPRCPLRISPPLSYTPHASPGPHRFFSTSSSTSASSKSSPSPLHSLPLFDYSASLGPQPTPLLTPLLHPIPASTLPSFIRIVEVGPRDGLQNEPTQLLSTALKVELIDRLSDCGLRSIEAASFVSPQWVPSMASSDEVLRSIRRHPSARYSALTPNLKGFQRALEADASEVAVFASASEGFSRANLNCSVAESLKRFEPVVKAARKAQLPVRGYVSCVIGCPYDGWTDPRAVVDVTRQLLAMGCYEVSLGDTIGVGTPGSVAAVLHALFQGAAVAPASVAVHFHDTYGQALANTLTAVLQGVRVVDASVAGLGGCPYAAGATGNVATEDVVYMLHGCGVDTGVDLRKLVETGWWISEKLGREVQSRAGKALGGRVRGQVK